jgi:hypothetical protein
LGPDWAGGINKGADAVVPNSLCRDNITVRQEAGGSSIETSKITGE